MNWPVTTGSETSRKYSVQESEDGGQHSTFKTGKQNNGAYRSEQQYMNAQYG